MKWILILLLGVALTANVWGQGWSFRSVGKQVDKLYRDHNWQELLVYGDSALANGVDYALLRSSMGIAAVFLNEPFVAIKHLEKALAFDSGNLVAREYLVYAYRAAEREGDALRLLRGQTRDFCDWVDLQRTKPIADIYLEGGARWSDKPDSVGTMPFGVIALTHRLIPTMSFTHGFSYLQLDYRGSHVQQYDYFANMPWSLAKGLTLRPFGHFAWVTGDASGRVVDPFFVADWRTDFKQTAVYGGLAAKINKGRFAFKPLLSFGSLKTESTTVSNIGLTFIDSSRIDSTTTIGTDYFGQANLDIGYTLPIWGNRLVLGGEGFFQFADTMPQFGWKARVRVQPLPRLYTSLEYAQLSGMRNFVEADGVVLNNALSDIERRVSLYGYYIFSKKISLMLVGIWDARNDQGFHFNNYTFVTTLKFSL